MSNNWLNYDRFMSYKITWLQRNKLEIKNIEITKRNFDVHHLLWKFLMPKMNIEIVKMMSNNFRKSQQISATITQ